MKPMSKEEAAVMSLVIAHLDRIEAKVDKVQDQVLRLNEVSIKQEANLAEHMRRTDLLEASQDDLKDVVKPLLKVYTVAWGLCKIGLGVSVLIGVIVGIIRIVEFL